MKQQKKEAKGLIYVSKKKKIKGKTDRTLVPPFESCTHTCMVMLVILLVCRMLLGGFFCNHDHC